ncbi:MAG: ArnT family glycosyltransferase [Bacteroidales bacterium]
MAADTAASRAVRSPSLEVAFSRSGLLVGVWAAVVLGFYYRRAFSLLLRGPHTWAMRDTVRDAAPALVVLAGALALVVCISWLAGRPHGRRVGAGGACALGVFVIVAVVASSGHATTMLPVAGAALRRALSSIAAATLVAFDAFVLGRALLRLIAWRTARCAERVVFTLAAGFAGISYLSLGTAAVGLYRPAFVETVLAVIAALGATWLVASTWFRGAVPSRSHWHSLVLGPSDKLWVTLSVAALAIALVAALAPETEYDALWYHLWLPQLWLQHGSAVDVPSEYVSLYPLTWELVFGAGLAMGGQVAAKLLHFVCLPLSGLAVWQFTRRFFPDSSPWLAAAILVTAPTVLWEATTAYIDLAVAFYVTLGVYALLAYLDFDGEDIPVRRDRQTWLLVAALCLGMATAIKHLGLIVLCLVALLTFLRLLRCGHGLRSLGPPLVLVAVALLLAAPWYWRAWHATGDPFFPLMYKVFGAPPNWWDAAAEQGLNRFTAHFGLPRTPWNLVALPWNTTMHAALFGGSVGPLFLAAMPAVLLWKHRTARERRAAGCLAFVALGYLIIWASPVSSFQLRFLLPLLPLLAVTWAAALSPPLHRFQPRTHRTAAALLALVLALNLPPLTALHEGDRVASTGWLTHVVREVPLGVVVGRTADGEYLRKHVPTYGAWQYAGSHLPSTAKVLEFGGGDNFYSTRERVWMYARAARPVWALGDGQAASVRRGLKHLGVTHVIFDRNELASLERADLAIASPAFRANALTLEYEDRGGSVYRVPPADIAGATGTSIGATAAR